ncbi:hypothetical protein [Bacillus sp. 03113]|uniref:hypothetical protein n=1 Tax=Bacillus sp. 03113 TaxID=2578211 RepID=UPI00114387BF|nr:hypothetical protein [Bacillus sp. 03113]
MGDILFQMISLGTLILPVLLIFFILIYVIRIVRRVERRAEDRLKLDKENATFQQQQMKAINELNNRLTNIENMLKEVD